MEASNVISTRGINYGEVEMDIESNLVSLLDDTLPNNDTKKRNIEIIPTLSTDSEVRLGLR